MKPGLIALGSAQLKDSGLFEYIKGFILTSKNYFYNVENAIAITTDPSIAAATFTTIPAIAKFLYLL